MNPMDVLYSWQTVLLAAVIVGLTQGLKACIESILLLRNKGTNKTGKDLRGEIALIDKAILPLFPLITGAVLGALVPIRPEGLVQYVTEHGHGSKWAYAMWGAAVGQFADYLYQRAKRLIPGGQDATRPSATPIPTVGPTPDSTPTPITDPAPATSDTDTSGAPTPDSNSGPPSA